MPEITPSVMPAAPVVAAAAPSGVASLAAGPAREPGGAAAANDPGAPSFLDQLKTALAGLSRGRVPLLGVPAAATAPAAADPAAQESEPAQAGDAAPLQAGADGTDAAATELPSILAELGFIAVPQMLPQTPTPAAGSSQPTAPGQATAALQGQNLGLLLAALGPNGTTTTAGEPAKAATLAEELAKLGSQTAPAAQSLTPADPQLASMPQAQAMPGQPVAHAAQASQAAAVQASQAATVGQSQSTLPTLQPMAATGAPVAETTPRPPSARLAGAAQPVAGLGGAVPSLGPTATSNDAGHASSGHGDGSAGASMGGAAKDSPQAAAPTPDAAFNQLFGAATGANAAASAAAQSVHPSQVVSQIAQQADLYRLPGNRGLRIQLNPDDLGGVEVTVRYNPTGGLELHVNVEHASTGALVQAGWSELRDALATHGISPDRLIMSVAAPTSASNTGSQDGFGARGDGGQSAAFSFAQSQSGQQRHDQGDARAAFGWSRSSLFDAAAGTDISPEPVARAAADTISRIDYRA